MEIVDEASMERSNNSISACAIMLMALTIVPFITILVLPAEIIAAGIGTILSFAALGFALHRTKQNEKEYHERQQADALLEMELRERQAAIELSAIQAAQVTPDANGFAPVPFGHFQNDKDMIRMVFEYNHAIAHSQQTHPNVPNTIRYEHKPQSEYYGVEGQAEQNQIGKNQSHSLIDMHQAGKIGKGDFYLGENLETGEGYRAGWNSLYSIAMAGQSGSGKSNTLRSIITQAALNGCEFCLIDGHAGHEESIARSLEPLSWAMRYPPVHEEQDAVEVIRLIDREGKQRMQASRDGVSDFTPLLIVIDEATSYLKRSSVKEEMALFLEKFGQEFRKYNVFAIVAAQTWSAKASGGSTELRNAFTSVMVHRYRTKSMARYLLDGDADMCQGLNTGDFVFSSTRGDIELLHSPLCTEEHVRQIAGNNCPSQVLPGSFLKEKAVDTAHETEGPGKDNKILLPPSDIRAYSVREAFSQGASTHAIVKEFWGIEGGRHYRQAAAEVKAMITS